MAATSLYTLEDLGLQVAQNYGATDDITIAKAYKWVNRALLIVAEIGDWQWLFVNGANIPTVISQETYKLAVGVKKLQAIYYTSGVTRKLRLIENRIFREKYMLATTPTGTPYVYRNVGRDATTGARSIALWPIPSSVLTLYYDYIREMPLLSAATDDVRIVCGMPGHMVDALIELATAVAFMELDASDYAEKMIEARTRWQRLYEDDTTEIDDSIRAASFDDSYVNPMDPTLPPQYG